MIIHMLNPQEIKELRLALGLTATQMGFRCGVSENCVRRWEMGNRRPNGDSLTALWNLQQEVDQARAVKGSKGRKELASK